MMNVNDVCNGNKKYPVIIRETITRIVEIEAESYDAAIEEAQNLYYEGSYEDAPWDDRDAEFEHCCSECNSSIDDYDIASEDTPFERILCSRCLEQLEDSGELTRCDNCGNVFDPSLLVTNDETDQKELCPYCGEVWCE